jgi:ribonuclease-3
LTRDLSRLSRALGYTFCNEPLLLEALTHRSVGARNNERLEFLGDSILSFVVTSELYARFPECDEGELSRYRARLVKGDTLAVVARRLKLGDYLRLGPGELRSGGFDRDSILANTVEAIIGAIYLDSGLENARTFTLTMLRDQFDTITTAGGVKDPKTQLQEMLQARRLPLPVYEVVSVTGEAHAQTFTVLCRVQVLDAPAEGKGTSRRKAEQDAAQKALRLLGSG